MTTHGEHRLEAARRRLEDSAEGVQETARACGYGHPEAIRRAFVRALGVSPAEYRRRFRPKTPPEQGLTQIVIALFDRFASLDAVGPFEVFTHVPDAKIIVASERSGLVRDASGSLAMSAQASYAHVPRPDVILIPGGPGQSD